ncbi:hypothetical protein BDY24DRAFT_383861 [Mrakia frigida]|uniref:SGNH/GDSL hydrolase family protein n=1 Tax=Mrakia frigida TaxID=29902 RepID=UPI003FCC0344
MRSIRTGPLPTILAVLAAFLVGLSSNRLFHETSKAAGYSTYHSDDSPPSWLGIDHSTGCGSAVEEESSVLEMGGGLEVGSSNGVSSMGEVFVKGEHERIRDEKMEEIIKVFGEAFFDKSVSYSGTNHRLRRIIRRALAGESIVIGVLGGSITVGNNTPRPLYKDNTYHALFWTWWQQAFPDAKHLYFPVGIGAVGSPYFSNCFLEHLPAEIDLVILDSAVNDQRSDEHHRSFDHLLRSLLTLPSAPAIVAMEFFAIPANNEMTTGGVNSLDSARYLDVPTLSIRNPLLPEVLLHPSRIPLFFGREPASGGAGIVDPRHPSLRGHLAAARILQVHVWKQILYVEGHNSKEDEIREKLAVSRIGVVDEEKEGVYVPGVLYSKEEMDLWQLDASFLEETNWGSREDELEVVSRMSLLDHYHPSSFIPPSLPRCRSLSGTREKLAFLSTTKGDRVENGTTFAGEGDGWFEWQSSPQKQYIITRSPGAQVTFSITVGLGDVKLWYLKSFEFGLGDARCWVDNDTQWAVRLVGKWERPHNIGWLGVIREGLSPGDHLLHCVLEGPGEFRISSLITG